MMSSTPGAGSSRSPNPPRRPSTAIPGFIPSKPRVKPISEINSIPELRGILERTTSLLETASNLLRPQLAKRKNECEARIQYLSNLHDAQAKLEHITIGTNPSLSSPLVSPTQDNGFHDATMSPGSPLASKFGVLSQSVSRTNHVHPSTHSHTARMNQQLAMELERKEAEQLRERRRALEEQRAKMQRNIFGDESTHTPQLTEAEKRARILAFMNYRPESDEEDEDDELDDEEMETMLAAEYEDGIKGQDIIEPDDLVDIIRVDQEAYKEMLDFVNTGERG